MCKVFLRIDLEIYNAEISTNLFLPFSFSLFSSLFFLLLVCRLKKNLNVARFLLHHQFDTLPTTDRSHFGGNNQRARKIFGRLYGVFYHFGYLKKNRTLAMNRAKNYDFAEFRIIWHNWITKEKQTTKYELSNVRRMPCNIQIFFRSIVYIMYKKDSFFSLSLSNKAKNKRIVMNRFPGS